MSEADAGIPEGTGAEGSLASAAAAFSAIEETIKPGEEVGSSDVEETPPPREEEEPEANAEGDEEAHEVSESDDADPEGEDSDDEPTYTVVINGKSVDVSQSELISGYQQASAGQKMLQDAAEARKAVEADRKVIEEARAKRDQYTDYLSRLEGHLQATSAEYPDEAMLDPASDKYDPDQYHIQFARARKAEGQLNAVKQEQQRVAQERQAEEAAEMQQHAQAEAAKLLDRVKEWRNPKVRAKEQQQLVGFLGKDYGFSQDEINQLGSSDHRLVSMARDAMKYAEIRANRSKAEGKVKDAPPVTKPGAMNKTPKQEKLQGLRGNLRKSGSVDDAAALFAALDS